MHSHSEPSVNQLKILNYFHNYLERILREFPEHYNKREHQIALAYTIDTLYDFGAFSEEIRNELYARYAL